MSHVVNRAGTPHSNTGYMVRGKLASAGGGGGRGSPPKEGGGGGVWQWGSYDKTVGKVPITLKRGC